MDSELLNKIWESICPPLYRDTDPTLLDQDCLAQVLAWDYNSRGIVLFGHTGTGKTRCAYLLLRQLLDKTPTRQVKAFDSTDFVNACADAFMNGTGSFWVNSMITVPILFLDDLGNEPKGERGSGEIFHVFKRRQEQLLPVIITTNAVGGEIAGNLKGPEDRGLALVRRLRELCDTVDFSDVKLKKL